MKKFLFYEKKENSNKFLYLIICIGLLAGLLIKLFIFEILTVSGDSMTPAINNGEHIFVNKLKYGLVKPYGETLLVQWNKPKRGDIVIYLYNNKIVVKRCLAISGDLLEYSTDNDYNYFLMTGNQTITLSENQYLNLKDSSAVPEGYILAVGDNYSVSVDSRTYGFVPERNILGKVLCK
ncbi:signal peptidase I [Treponema sp.]|uniref:signal peptidase I n=1 Tax=Treponema sp. TaxID=166 RepID=UPI00388FE346